MAEAIPAAGSGPARTCTAAQRFRRDRLAMAAAAVLLVLAGAALVGGSAWRWDHDERDRAALSTSPSVVHPMGTDGIGRDVLAQVLRGAQRSLLVAAVVAGLSTAVGTLVGGVAGYQRGAADAVLMRLTDAALVVPGIAVFAVLAARAGGSWLAVAVVISSFSWMPVARVVRAAFLSLREQGYVESARALGAGSWHITAVHLLPNALGPVIVSATLAVPAAILAEAGLSFLGLGIQPPDVSLGLLIETGQQAIGTRPWLFYAPGAVILLVCLCVNVVGEGLRQAFEPGGRPDQ